MAAVRLLTRLARQTCALISAAMPAQGLPRLIKISHAASRK
jgi:hypothetical protein